VREASTRPRERLGPPEFVLLAFSGAGLVFFVALGIVWVPSLARLYADFGGVLPGLTRLVLTRTWVGGGALLIVAGALGGALAPARRARISLLVVALTIAVLAAAATLFGAYLPLFQLADAVRAG
jgi:hypothetical protein